MNRTLFILGFSALALGSTTSACSVGQIFSAGTRAQSRSVQQAQAAASDAEKALAKGKLAKAVASAELAASLQPQDANYRALLGQAYLQSGRFASAKQALSDALALDPNQGRAALSLALVQTANGNFDVARETLDAHQNVIAPSDRGLAIALAGDPAAAVQILTEAARAPGADAKTRQNLALALALNGRWQEAKIVASADLAPAEVEQRIAYWASFARPGAAATQVSALLGVTQVNDPGQPTALALNAGNEQVAMAVQSAPSLDKYMPGVPANADAVVKDMSLPPVAEPAAEPIVQAAEVPASTAPAVAAKPTPAFAFAERTEAAPRPQVAAISGNDSYYVQLGAYRSSNAVRTAWASATNRHPALASRSPSSVSVSAKGGTFYRLSVGTFARGDADKVCAGLKREGSACFVRAGAGDRVASWARAPQVAMR